MLARRPCRIDGAEFADEAWMLRFFSESDGDRVLIVNLGRDLLLGPTPEPLLAPVEDHAWRLLWSSEALPYGVRATRCRTSTETGLFWARPPWSSPLSHRRGSQVGQGSRSSRSRWLSFAAPSATRACYRGLRVNGSCKRVGRLCLGDDNRSHHPALPRPSDRRPTASAWANGSPRRSRSRHRARRRQHCEYARERSIPRFYVEHGSTELAIRARWGRH